MKTIKTIGIVLTTLVLVFVVGGFVMPKAYTVERSVRVQAPVELVFSQVNDLRNWEKWSPWKAADPTMALTYSDNPVGQGASYQWKGESAGEGSLTITRSTPSTRVETRLDFGEMGSAQGYWDFAHEDGVTDVTWGFTGENSGVIGGWFTLMMDGMVGPSLRPA